MLKSIVAVVCGVMAIGVLSLGADAALKSIVPESFTENGRVDNSSLLILALVYTLIFSAIGGYVTALVARRAELKHVLALGILELVFGILATLQFYNTAPLWWHVLFLLLMVPAIMLGGYLRRLQKRDVQPHTT